MWAMRSDRRTTRLWPGALMQVKAEFLVFS
jgi:hypothetical protein